MSSVIGKIESLNGKFFIKAQDGSIREAKEGEVVYKDELVYGDRLNLKTASIIVAVDGGAGVMLTGDEQQLFDKSLATEKFSKDEVVTQKESIAAMLESMGEIKSIDGIETAAGAEVDGVASTDGNAQAIFAQANNAQTDVNAELLGSNTPTVASTADAIVYNLGEDIRRSTGDDVAPQLPTVPAGGSSIVVMDNTGSVLGVVLNGGVTNDARAMLGANGAEAGATVTIYDNGSVVGTATVGANGAWSFSPTTDLAEGTHSLTYTLTDGSGNVSEMSASTVITLDTIVATPTADIANASDTGASNSDNITSNNTPTITGAAEAGSTVVIANAQGVEIGRATVGSDGTYSITTSALADGTQALTITATDTAGNQAQTTQSITVDTGIATPTATVADASDTGSSNSDNITSNNTPTIAGTAEAGAKVEILNGTTVIATTYADENGNYSVTTPALADATYSLNIRATDLAGNTATTVQTVTIDTTAAVGTAGAVVMAQDNDFATNWGFGDSRSVASGNIFTGEGAVSKNGVVTSFDNGTSISGSGEVVEVKFYARLNGTTSDVNLDGDGNGWFNGSLDADGNLTARTDFGTFTMSPNGNWSLSPHDFEYSQSNWQYGFEDFSFSVKVADDAGNVSDWITQNVMINHEADANADSNSIAEDAVSVSGNVLANDFDQNNYASYSGRDDDGQVLSVTNAGSYVGSYGTLTLNSDGTYSYALDNSKASVQELGEGEVVTETFGYTVSDGVGGVATSSLTIAVVGANDAPSVTAATATVQEDQSITGRVSASDVDGDALVFAVADGATAPVGLTLNSDGSYVFDASSYDALGAGETRVLEVPVSVTDAHGSTVSTTLTINVGGVANELAYTEHSAGYKNVIGYYELNGAGEPINPATVLIDNQQGLAGGTHLADLDATKSYGFFILPNAADSIDANSIITFGTAGQLSIDGTASNLTVYHDTPSFNADGKDHFVFSQNSGGGMTIGIEDLSLGDADYNDIMLYSDVVLADKIGNDTQANNDSATVNEDGSVTINVLANDRDGTHDALSITKIAGVDVSAGQSVGIVMGGVAVGAATVVDGKIVFTPAANYAGAANFSYTVSDGHSGESTTSVSVSITADSYTLAPTADIADLSDTGSNNSDNITKDNTPTITGTTENGATVVITAGGVEVGRGVADANGNYSITTTALGAGAQTLTITATDTAGNTAVTTQSITVDTVVQPPLITNIVDANGDYASVMLHGTGEAGATITLFAISGSTTGGNATQTGSYTALNIAPAIVVGADGKWSVDISNLADVSANDNEFFKATQTDVAGNVSSDSNTAHYWHGTWSGLGTEAGDDFVMAGAGNDTGYFNVDDANNRVVFDGGDGADKAVFNISHNSITSIELNQSGEIVVTETNGDIDVFRNVELVRFADGAYSVVNGALAFDGSTFVTADIAASSDTGSSNTDNITSDTTPTITGTGEAGSAVVLTTAAGVVLGKATVAADGSYSITVPADKALSVGTQTLTVTATDAAGNVAKSAQSITVDVAAPTVSVNSVVTNDSSPALSGTIDDATATVKVTIEGISYSAVNNGDGTWTLADNTINNLDSVGVHDITVTAEDLAGNAIVETTVNALNVYKVTDLGGSGDTLATFKLTGDHYDPANAQDVGTGSPKYQILVDGVPFVAADGNSTFSVEASRGELNSAGNGLVRNVPEFELVSLKIPAGATSVSIKFINDAYDGATSDNDHDGVLGEDRNLVVDKLNIGGTIGADGAFVGGETFEAENPLTTQYLAGTSDVSGREAMAWSGTMTFFPDGIPATPPLITNIADANGDYSSMMLHGTGEAGATITLWAIANSTTAGNATQVGSYTALNIVPAIVVGADGKWSVDISNLADVPVNDNEFFKATQTNAAGNTSDFSNTAHYWHGTWTNVSTEAGDDFVMSGAGNDTISFGVDDSNDRVVFDGGAGSDKALFNMNHDSITSIVKNASGEIVVTETNGDVNVLRNVETVQFSDGAYSLDSTGGLVYASADVTASAPTLSFTITQSVATTTGAFVQADANGASTTVGSADRIFNTHDGSWVAGTAGNDDIRYNQSQFITANVSLGDGNDSIYAAEHMHGSNNLGSGSDTLYANQTVGLMARVDMGDGNDNLYANEHIYGNVTAGAGDDHVQTGQMNQGILDMGDGNDTFISGEHIAGRIDMGAGNDYAQTGQNIQGHIYGGDGYDTIKFGDQNAQNNWSSLKGYVHGFEKVIFANGATYDLDANSNLVASGTNNALKVGTTTTAYQYAMTLKATLTDVDGSEVLSPVTISGLPSGVTTVSVGSVAYTVTGGSCSIPVVSGVDTTVVMTSATQITPTALNSISATVSSTESSSGATATKAVTHVSPLILDLDGDGVESASMANGVNFDIDADGDMDRTGWVGQDDGLLVRDVNNDGAINDGSELFGNNTALADGSKADDGFEALGQFDANADGKIDSSDGVWNELKIWRDADGDGKVSDGEMMTLEQAGVKSMNLDYETSAEMQNGNEHSMQGSYTTTDGATAEMTDVWFATQSEQLTQDDSVVLGDLVGDVAVTTTTSGEVQLTLGDIMDVNTLVDNNIKIDIPEEIAVKSTESTEWKLGESIVVDSEIEEVSTDYMGDSADSSIALQVSVSINPENS